MANLFHFLLLLYCSRVNSFSSSRNEAVCVPSNMSKMELEIRRICFSVLRLKTEDRDLGQHVSRLRPLWLGSISSSLSWYTNISTFFRLAAPPLCCLLVFVLSQRVLMPEQRKISKCIRCSRSRNPKVNEGGTRTSVMSAIIVGFVAARNTRHTGAL